MREKTGHTTLLITIISIILNRLIISGSVMWCAVTVCICGKLIRALFPISAPETGTST